MVPTIVRALTQWPCLVVPTLRAALVCETAASASGRDAAAAHNLLVTLAGILLCTALVIGAKQLLRQLLTHTVVVTEAALLEPAGSLSRVNVARREADLTILIECLPVLLPQLLEEVLDEVEQVTADAVPAPLLGYLDDLQRRAGGADLTILVRAQHLAHHLTIVAQREERAEAVRLQVRVLEAFVPGLLVCAFAMHDLEREAHHLVLGVRQAGDTDTRRVQRADKPGLKVLAGPGVQLDSYPRSPDRIVLIHALDLDDRLPGGVQNH
eukprot:scaffold66799_cov72-Phaeocystis_antarctica.AAC.1